MVIVRTISELREKTNAWKSCGQSIGFVPTMGFLHKGHESLIINAASENDKVIVSIFVNPTQFGPNEDFSKYPRDLKKDEELCLNAGADMIFLPEVSEMYAKQNFTFVDVEKLTVGLCGAKRPGHFRGVCTVVAKLFNIVTPDKAYFGEKDAQQLAVIKNMVEDLNFNIKVIGCPIIRESDGLAMSSRNTYLSKEERIAALILSKSLERAKLILGEGEFLADTVKTLIRSELQTEPLAKIDYIEVVDSMSLESISEIKSDTLIAIAVFIGKTRLIDNFIWNV